MKNRKPTYEALEKELEMLRQEKEEIFSALYNNSPNMCASVCAIDGSVLFCNQTFLIETGYSLKEVIGFPIFEIYHKDCVLEAKKAVQQFIKFGKIRNKELTLRRKNGTKIFVILNANPIKNNKGEVLYSISSWRDITAQKNTELAILKAVEKAEDIEAKFKAYTAQSQIAICTTGADGDFIYANDAWLKMADMKKKEAVGKGWMNAIHPDDLGPFNTNWQRSIKSGGRHYYEYRFLNKNGQIIWVEGTAKEIFNRKNELVGYLGNNVKITHRKKAEETLKESEGRFKNMFEGNKAIMLLLEPKTGSIIDANNSAIKFYGYDKAKLCSMKMDDINILSAKQVLTERTKAKEEERNYFWFSHKTANDEVRAVEVHSSFITFNNQQILFSIIYDVTDRKKAKQALLKSEQQQKELNATKDKLFSIISHDLRSPFNSIIGLSDLLTDSTENQSVEDSKVIVKMINSSSKSALILLDNLLDWARSQTGQISFNPINLNLKLIIIETFELLKPTAQIKNIALKYNQYTDFEVYADENMLKIILHNLISNGIKFNNTNGKIDIYTEQKQNGIEITVSDNGVGISKDIQSMLFNVYKNTTTRGTSNEKGSGLGLLICKEFLDKHNGHIWAESELGKGSTIKFILPYKI